MSSSAFDSTGNTRWIGRTMSSESQFEKAFRLVKEKLSCSQHSGENQWCWVDPRIPNAEHIPLCLGDILIWVKCMNNQPVDSYCAAMPDNIHFMELLKTRHPRSTTLRRIPTEPAFSSNGHDSIRPSELQLIANPADTNRSTTSNVPYQLWQHAAYLEADREDPYNIGRTLDNIHVRYPAFHYPQYEGQLRSHGIHYLVNASMFDVDFYIARIGMVEGAARLFSQWVAQELKMVQHTGQSQDKRAGVEVGENKGKENVMP